MSVISLDKSFSARKKALETGPYGRCIYKCGNTAVDNQVVCAEFENNVTFNFAVYANTFRPNRTIRIIGSDGELSGDFEKKEISIIRFGQGFGEKQKTQIFKTEIRDGAHGGGDIGDIRNFLRCFKDNDYKSIKYSLDIAVEGHLLAFAAEEARVKGQVVNMSSYKKSIKTK